MNALPFIIAPLPIAVENVWRDYVRIVGNPEVIHLDKKWDSIPLTVAAPAGRTSPSRRG
jgi:hypothetical protein